jgi:rare lipoprotein A
MRVLRIVAIAAVPAWMSLHIGPAAAQTFDERWSIIPNAHAEPAPATPHAEPAPEAPGKNNPELQARPSTGGDSAHETRPPTGSDSAEKARPPIGADSEDRSATRSFNRAFSGKASYYSYQTGKTASGSSFDRNLPTAAHRSLPFGTRVRVTDLATNRSVVVVISDRGPRVRDRVIDLSLGAARTLGITDRGVAQVRVEVL